MYLSDFTCATLGIYYKQARGQFDLFGQTCSNWTYHIVCIAHEYRTYYLSRYGFHESKHLCGIHVNYPTAHPPWPQGPRPKPYSIDVSWNWWQKAHYWILSYRHVDLCDRTYSETGNAHTFQVTVFAYPLHKRINDGSINMFSACILYREASISNLSLWLVNYESAVIFNCSN